MFKCSSALLMELYSSDTRDVSLILEKYETEICRMSNLNLNEQKKTVKDINVFIVLILICGNEVYDAND